MSVFADDRGPSGRSAPTRLPSRRPAWRDALALAVLSSAVACSGASPADEARREEARAEALAVAQDSIDMRRRLERRATDIEARLDSLRSVEGTRKVGDASSSFVAHFEDEELRAIVDSVDLGAYGSSRGEYYFEGDSLFYYLESKLSKVVGSAGGPSTDAIVVRLYFDDAGELVLAERTLNGAPVPLDGYEESTVRRHAAELRATVLGDDDGTLAARGPISVELPAGATSAAFEGRILARETQTYIVDAEEDQTLSVRLDTPSRFAQFMVQFTGQSVFDSGREGEREWSAVLPRGGAYTVRVYLARAEAQRGGRADYTLTIGIE